jgi:hypothetical protein
MVRFNLSHAQATTLASRLVDALDQNSQNSAEVPPPYNYGYKFSRIIAEGLSIDQAVTAEGLGIRSGRRQHQNRGRGGQSQQLPDAQCPANLPQVQATARQSVRRPVSPTPLGFEHNRGPAFIPFHIQENSRETPAQYIWAHLDAPNPFVEGRLSLEGPTYHSKIHTMSIHNVDIPPPPIMAELLRLLQTDYMGHDCVDEALSELSN